MSYYGMKNLKVVKLEDGYNVSCTYYDSSLRDYNGNRIWYDTNKLFKNSYETREDLEDLLFKDFLDGNIHSSGNCGKFSCLAWGNCKVELPENELEELRELDKLRWSNECSWEDYHNKRYDYYKRAWIEYLKKQKEDNKKFKGNKFALQVDFKGYKDIYVSSLGSTRVKFSYTLDGAKKFSGNPEIAIKKLQGFSNIENIREVTLQK